MDLKHRSLVFTSTTLASVHSCLREDGGLWGSRRQERSWSQWALGFDERSPTTDQKEQRPQAAGRSDRIALQTGFPGCPWPPPGPTHILEAAHEVVADGRARQVRRVGAAPNVEEVVRAQHGVILLRVACGGQDPVHRDGHLPSPGREGERQGDNRHQLPGKSLGLGKGGAGGQQGRGTPPFLCLLVSEEEQWGCGGEVGEGGSTRFDGFRVG